MYDTSTRGTSLFPSLFPVTSPPPPPITLILTLTPLPKSPPTHTHGTVVPGAVVSPSRLNLNLDPIMGE